MLTSTNLKRALAILMLVSLALTACGGAPQAAPTTAPTATTASTGSGPGTGDTHDATAAPKPTPDNSVATAVPGADNYDFATALALGKDPVKASVNEKDLYYKIDVPQGGIVTATLSVDAGSPEPARVALYNEMQNYLNELRVAVGKSDRLVYIFGSNAGGTVYFSVAGNSSFTLQGSASPQNDAGIGEDAGDDFNAAAGIETGQATGLLGGDDRMDTYALDVPKTGLTLAITFETLDKEAGDARLTVYEDNQNWRGEVNSQASDTDPGELELVLAAGEGGPWFIQVYGVGAYQYDVQIISQNDAGAKKDAGEDFDGAFEIETGEFDGLLGGTDSRDFFAIDLPETGTVVSITFATRETEGGDLRFTLYDDNENWRAEAATDSNNTEPAGFEYLMSTGEGGRWYLEVYGTGRYEFTFQTTPQDDAGTGTDAPGEQEQALEIDDLATFAGRIGEHDDSDAYRIDDSLGHTVRVTYAGGEGTLRVTIYSLSGDWVADGAIDEAGGTLELVDTGSEGYFVVIQGDYATYDVEIAP